MVNKDTIANAAILLFSVLLLAWLIPGNTPPYQGYGVSPALIPNVTAGIMLFLSFAGLLRAIWSAKTGRSTGERVDFGVFRAKLLHVVTFMVPCFLLFPAMKLCGDIPGIGQLGFFLPGILFLLGIQYLCGQRNWLHNALVAVLTVAGFYAAMRYGFGVAMP